MPELSRYLDRDIAAVRLHREPTLDDLQAMLARLVDLQGCPACGLNGFDLSFHLDPRVLFTKFTDEFREQVSAVDLVKNVNRARSFG